MKKSIFLIILNLFLINVLFSQNTFNWNDAKFEIGSKKVLKFEFDFDGPCTIKPCYNYRENAKEYDELIHFLVNNPQIKVSVKYIVSSKYTVVSSQYFQRLSESRTKGLRQELLKINRLNRQIKFGEFYFSDTLKSISGYEITIIENELSPHIKLAISDSALDSIYNEQFDYFKLKPDTTNNTDLDNLGFYLEKVLTNDTSLVIEIIDIHNNFKPFIHKQNAKIISQYLQFKFAIQSDKFNKNCTIKPYITTNYDKIVIIKVVSKQDYENCIKERIKDGCKNCPF